MNQQTSTVPDRRASQRAAWLRERFPDETVDIVPASEDASFRRYFRFHSARGTRILMDAPPDREDNHAFVDVAQRLTAAGLNVPRIETVDYESGFLIITDLGRQQYLHSLTAANADRLYADALDALLRLQCRGRDAGLPHFDRPLLLEEMRLFRDWLLRTHLNLSLSAAQLALLEQSFDYLADAALVQPRVFVHRDYHSRNLMITESNNPGVLDFQDAVSGPLTYDLVSLLRDCYVRWPTERVRRWVRDYLGKARAQGLAAGISDGDFMTWFDLMGVQRHLKASGIFARLFHRDGKPGYLKDIPRTLGYITQVSEAYLALHPLGELVSDHVLPALETP